MTSKTKKGLIKYVTIYLAINYNAANLVMKQLKNLIEVIYVKRRKANEWESIQIVE